MTSVGSRWSRPLLRSVSRLRGPTVVNRPEVTVTIFTRCMGGGPRNPEHRGTNGKKSRPWEREEVKSRPPSRRKQRQLAEPPSPTRHSKFLDVPIPSSVMPYVEKMTAYVKEDWLLKFPLGARIRRLQRDVAWRMNRRISPGKLPYEHLVPVVGYWKKNDVVDIVLKPDGELLVRPLANDERTSRIQAMANETWTKRKLSGLMTKPISEHVQDLTPQLDSFFFKECLPQLSGGITVRKLRRKMAYSELGKNNPNLLSDSALIPFVGHWKELGLLRTIRHGKKQEIIMLPPKKAKQKKNKARRQKEADANEVDLESNSDAGPECDFNATSENHSNAMSGKNSDALLEIISDEEAGNGGVGKGF